MNEIVSNAINFVGYPDAKSFFELANRVGLPFKNWSKSGAIIICATACVTVAIIVYAAYVGGNISILLPVFVGILVPIGLIVVISKLLIKRNIKTQRANYERSVQKEPRTGSISSSGISVEIANGKSKLQWAYFDRLVEIDGAFGLCRRSNMVDSYSRSMFKSQESFEAARKIALENLKVSP